MATVEAGVLAVALSPLNPEITYVWWAIVLVVLLTAIVGWGISQSYGFNLRERTIDPHLAWLYLHSLYWSTGILNGFVLYAFILYVIGGGAFVVNWPLLLAIAIVVWWLSIYYLLQLAGQGYATLRGNSFAGVGAFARLSRGVFSAQKRQGTAYLSKSLMMAKAVFEQSEYVPTDLDAVHATVEGLAETDTIPFDQLTDLARAMETLPRRDEIPIAFKTFLDTVKWPRGFEYRGSQRHSDYPRLNVLLTIAITGAALLAVLSEDVRHAVIESAAGFTVQNIPYLFAITLFLLALRLIIYTVTYAIPWTLVRKHWPSVESIGKRNPAKGD